MAAEGEKKLSLKKDEIKRQAQEQGVVDGFNQLRQEQRALTGKLIELEMELNEHKAGARKGKNAKESMLATTIECLLWAPNVTTEGISRKNLVAEALQKVDGDRRCYRMVGGVLVERTVKDILPAVERNKENISKSVELLNEKIVQKGQEVNEYREKHNIQIRVSSNAASKSQPPAGSSGGGEKPASQPATGVLV
ncbi:prefoldin subunit 2 isoform X2 [Dermacentor andersoni]|uniref:prefoldin subunit 2 isoform X2 n=1 Tax=Dermacentor andersoni TaxID=34620 RepID=UPI00241600EC|nr:prefoldin subunit 2-like isoform X1 [Dermacentor andersoni]